MNIARITCAVSLGLAGAVLPAHASEMAPATAATPAASPSTSLPVPETKLFRGDDQVMRAPAPSQPVTGAANSFKFEEAPISDVAHLVLRDILKVDYVLHQPLLGSVTMSTAGRVSADQAIHLLETALQANGLLLARDARGVYHVGKPESLRAVVSLPRQATASGPLAPGYGPLIISPRFVGAGELANILRPILPADALMRVDTVRNLLVLVGTRAQVEGWLDIANTFDVDLLKGMSVGVFPLKYATTKEVEAALQLMASASGATPTTRPASGGATSPATTPNPTNPTGAATGTGGTAASRAATAAQAVTGLPENFPLHGAIRVLPVERMNSVIVVTPRAAYLEEARKWIERLDQPGYSAGEGQLFVYRVQNGSARHLADVLNGVYGGTSAPAGTPVNTGVAPGLSTVQSGTALGGARTAAATTSGAATQNRNVTAATFASGLRVVADEINNSVLVYGSLSEYRKIESTLKRLDVTPTQVLIEASIVEVTLSDELKYGLQWAFSDSRSNGDVGSGLVSALPGLGDATAALSYTLTRRSGDVRAVLQALAGKSLIKVISSPSLMVLDNHTASIIVGDQQPIQTSTTVTDGGNTTTSIQYKDTGVALTVTPSVNAGNIVTMSINQSVTDVGAVDDQATKQRSFLQRQIASKVAVRSGEAIVLGGLIRDNNTNSRAGVPFLHDIPVVGNLFGSTDNSGRRTELLVVITPRVVRTDVDATAVSEELRDRMAGVRRLMEEGAREGVVQAPEAPLAPSGTDPIK